jgi:leucyl aminopeptidase
MRISTHSSGITRTTGDVLVVPVFEGDSPRDGALAELNEATGGVVASVFETGEFTGKRETWTLFHRAPVGTAGRVLLYGAGSPSRTDPAHVQRIAGAAVRVARDRAARSVAFALTSRLASPALAQAAIEGALIGAVNGALYQSSSNGKGEVESFSVVSTELSESQLETAARLGREMGEAVNLARMLAFEPSNVMTPMELASRAQRVASHEGLGFHVHDEAAMNDRGMGALLAVSRGSVEPAQLIELEYKPAEQQANAACIALVGKGITFDSGGISIKPAEKMEDMKYDMAGGAAVIAAMQILARLKPGVRVLGLIPAAENLPSGRAVKPGDVVRSLSGKTIEVVDSDAEGRLVLCDAVTYAISRGATTIVDAATLTGAVAIALGDVRGGVMGNNDGLVEALVRAGDECGELVWPMPMDDEYEELIRSDIADVRNSGNRTAGAITAGWFLRLFAGETEWAHLDIAGTGWTEEEKPYIARGATGFGTRLMARFVLNRANFAN